MYAVRQMILLLGQRDWVCTLFFNISVVRLPCISGYICTHLDARRACQHGIPSITSEQEKVPVVFHRVTLYSCGLGRPKRTARDFFVQMEVDRNTCLLQCFFRRGPGVSLNVDACLLLNFCCKVGPVQHV